MPDTDMSPLGQMMMDNTEVIQNAIDTDGPATVANWFMNVAGTIAASYDLVPSGDGTGTYTTPEESSQ